MFAAFPFEKDTPYWRAVPRSEVHELPEPLPTFCEVPVTVSCLGWLVLKITVPAAVVAEAMVFSPVLASCIIQPFAASSAAAALVRSEEHTSELQSQFHLVCRLLLEKK